MIAFHIDPESYMPFMIFAIPIIAIAGGITAGIVKTIGQQRLIEMAQRERIAAIERGIDPAKLPPLPDFRGDDVGSMYLSPLDFSRRRAQGLMIGGIITLAVGLSLGAFLALLSEDKNVWAVGLIPAAVGAALLLSSWLVHPRNGGQSSGTLPRP